MFCARLRHGLPTLHAPPAAPECALPRRAPPHRQCPPRLPRAQCPPRHLYEAPREMRRLRHLMGRDPRRRPRRLPAGRRRAHPAPANREGDRSEARGGAGRQRPEDLRTKGGEPTIVRLANGRLQLRLAPPGRMTKAAEQLFFTRRKPPTSAWPPPRRLRPYELPRGRARRCPGLAGELRIGRRSVRDRVWGKGWRGAARRRQLVLDSGRPMPKLTAGQAIFQLHFHRPDGQFQRAAGAPGPCHRPSFSQLEPRIRAKLAAWARSRMAQGDGELAVSRRAAAATGAAAGAGDGVERGAAGQGGLAPRTGAVRGLEAGYAGKTEESREGMIGFPFSRHSGLDPEIHPLCVCGRSACFDGVRPGSRGSHESSPDRLVPLQMQSSHSHSARNTGSSVAP